MKLIRARATNYRNIVDSNEVDFGQSTCLVGKNEAGKSAFLKVLEGLRSTNPTFKQYSKIENYPRRYLADYAERHPHGHAVVIRTIWELSTDDVGPSRPFSGRALLTARQSRCRRDTSKIIQTGA